MYDPAVRCKGLVDLTVAVLHQCIRPLVGACCAPGHHGYQRAFDLMSGQASKGPFGSPVFACAGKTDPPSRLILSQTSAGKGCRLCHRLLLASPCSFVRALRPFLRPGLQSSIASRAGAVKAGPSRCPHALLSTAARPRLDGSEHGARIKQVGTPSQSSCCTRRRVPCGGRPRRCGRACWRAQSPARCDAVAFWPPRSRISVHSAPTVLT
jgi:hypothetical protein